MATVDIRDTAGKTVGEQSLADAVFGIEPNGAVVHQVVRSQLAARRAGTHSSKGRSEVRGGGRKPWRQKGTGRARAGTIRSPLWRGGGVTFGPQPREHGFKVPRKMVKLAMRSVLSSKADEGALFVVDSLEFEKPSTKQAQAVLDALGVEGRVTVVVENGDENAVLSFRNLPKVLAIEAEDANTYDLINNSAVVFVKPALEWLEGVLS
jgi:large subunit ribosomal protein L4